MKSNLPDLTPGMRLVWRVADITPVGSTGARRSHSRCLVQADGTPVATIGNDSVPQVQCELRKVAREHAR